MYGQTDGANLIGCLQDGERNENLKEVLSGWTLIFLFATFFFIFRHVAYLRSAL
jgi:hypothetical protein